MILNKGVKRYLDKRIPAPVKTSAKEKEGE